MAWAVLSGILHAGIVVLIRVLVRHAVTSTCLAIVVLAFLEYSVYFLAGSSPAGACVYAIAGSICTVWLYTRVGVLAAIAFFLVIRSMSPFGLAFDAWSAPYLIANIVFLTALGAYSFWVSLAGQPIFKDLLAELEPAR